MRNFIDAHFGAYRRENVFDLRTENWNQVIALIYGLFYNWAFKYVKFCSLLFSIRFQTNWNSLITKPYHGSQQVVKQLSLNYTEAESEENLSLWTLLFTD